MLNSHLSWEGMHTFMYNKSFLINLVRNIIVLYELRINDIHQLFFILIKILDTRKNRFE